MILNATEQTRISFAKQVEGRICRLLQHYTLTISLKRQIIALFREQIVKINKYSLNWCGQGKQKAQIKTGCSMLALAKCFFIDNGHKMATM